MRKFIREWGQAQPFFPSLLSSRVFEDWKFPALFWCLPRVMPSLYCRSNSEGIAIYTFRGFEDNEEGILSGQGSYGAMHENDEDQSEDKGSAQVGVVVEGTAYNIQRFRGFLILEGGFPLLDPLQHFNDLIQLSLYDPKQERYDIDEVMATIEEPNVNKEVFGISTTDKDFMDNKEEEGDQNNLGMEDRKVGLEDS